MPLSPVSPRSPLGRPRRSAAVAGFAVALAVALSPTVAPVTSASASASAAIQPPAADTATASAGAPSADAEPGGPRATSIRLSDDDASTTVLVHGLGDAQTERHRENRRMRHSDLQPTARYVTQGERLTVTVPDGAPQMSVVIGLYGAHSFSNGGGARNRATTVLTPGENSVVAALDGMVFLRSTVVGGSADVTVRGGQPVPHFVRGQTSNEQFRSELERLTDAPLVTVIGERIFGDFQRGRTGAQIAAADLEARVTMWDETVEITNATYALHDDATGVSRKAPHRIYVASPDAIPGAYATAGDESINFPASGAARDLFVRDQTQLWGFWHEIGHTYQVPGYLWSGMGEVTVNISPLHVESARGWGSTVDSTGHLNTLNRFFAKPVDERDYATSGTNEIFFDHLRRGFGDEFYPRLNQEMRVMAARGDAEVATDDAKRQLFAVTAARVADRDLREHFRQWGFALSDETKAVMAELPPLEKPIWDNRHSRDLIREYEMPAYSYPQGSISPVTEPVSVGQRVLSATPEVSDLRDSDGVGPVRVQDHTIRAGHPGTGAVDVAVVNSQGVRELLSTPVTVTPGDSFHYIGVSNRDTARLAYQAGTGELRMFASSGYPSHDNFRGEEYVGATVYDHRGREQASFSVLGQDNAKAAAAAFDGTTMHDGWYLEVRHREANSRLVWWADDVEQPRNAATTRLLRAQAGDLVPVAAVPTPSPLMAVDDVEPVTLTRGATSSVPVTAEATQAVGSVTAEMVLTAPQGTRFAADQEALVTQVRQPGGTWVALDDLVVEGSVLSEDGTMLTLTLSSAGDLDLTDGTRLRWAPTVAVPVDAPRGGSALGWSLTGTADGAAVTARG